MIETTFQQFEARTREIAKGNEALKQSLDKDRARCDQILLKDRTRHEKAL